MDDLTGIVEVVEAGYRKANKYLAHGYKLLAINGVSTWKNAEPGDKRIPGWVLRLVVYSLGRTADVEAWAPEPRATAIANILSNATPEAARAIGSHGAVN